MFNKKDFRQSPVVAMPNQDGFIDIDNNSGTIDIDLMQAQTTSQNVNTMNAPTQMTTQTPIMEPARERVVHRNFEHIVPHVCPIQTRIINHHIYKHTYSPQYTCCEENVCENIQCGSCCNY